MSTEMWGTEKMLPSEAYFSFLFLETGTQIWRLSKERGRAREKENEKERYK